MGLSGQAAAQTSVSASDRIYEDRVDLTWSRVSTPEVVYQVERDGRQIASLASTDSTYSDTEGDPTFTYTYCVFAESDTGRQQLGCDAGTRALNAPVNLTASVRTEASGVALAWDDRSDIEDAFLLFRKVTGTDADSTQIALLPRNTDRYEDESAEPDVRYTYCLASTNDTRDFFSERICAEGIRAVVQPPAEVRASDGSYDDRVFLSWTDNSDRDAGFEISRIELDDSGAEVDTTVLPVTAPNATTYSDLEAVNGTPYRYCVKTVAQGGGTSIADCDRGIRGVLPTPTPVQASTDEFDDRVVVQWGDPSESESGFEVWRKEAGTPFDSNRVATPGKNVQEYIDNDAIPGTSYVYFVRAVAEDGGASDFATDTGRQSVVLAPTGMNATDDAFEDRVALNWQNPSTTATVVRIYREGVQIQTLPAETVSFEDTEAASGVTNEYCVEHITDAGALSSRACDTGIRTILPPEDVTASDRTDETSVRLTWTDASSVETEQHIYRDGVVIDTVAADAVSYRDGTAVPAQVHTYDVQAVDDWGASERVSDAGERVLNPPTEVQASDDESELEITLSWLDNSSVEDGYYVYRKTSATDSTLAGTTDANAVSFTDTGMDVGAELTYSVIPFDEFGSSSAVEDVGSTVLLPPASVRAQGYNDGVTLSWVDVSDVENGYRILQDSIEIAVIPPNTESYSTPSFPFEEFEFCVEAISSGSKSQPSCTTSSSLEIRRTISSINSRKIQAADIDLDGDKDVVASSSTGIFYYENNGVDGFNAPVTIYENADESAFTIYTEDIDQDGRVDIVSGGYSTDSVVWYKNLGGGSFERIVITNTLDGVRPVYAVDFDMDGDVDIVVGSPNTSSIRLYLNDGSQGFSESIVTSDARGVYSLEVADLDGDGDNDIVAANNFELSADWYENNGQQGFTENDLGVGSFTDVVVADLDNDNRLDVVASGVNANTVYFKNNGGGTFTESIIANHLDATGSGTRALHAADLNNDGLTDLVSKSFDIKSPSIDLSWYKNTGGGQFEEVLIGFNFEASSVFATDLSGDERLEVLATGREVRAYFGFVPSKTRLETLTKPTNVEATDGNAEDQVVVSWNDSNNSEDGYRIYRDGRVVGTVPPDESRFSDTDAPSGLVSEYCVAAYVQNGESETACDFGYNSPNGAFTGRVTTQSGAAVDSVDVCLHPSPGRSLQLDGRAERFGFRSYGLAENVQMGSSAFTLEAWVKMRNETIGSGGFSALLSYAIPSNYNEVLLTLNNNNNFSLYINGSEYELDVPAGSVSPQRGEWTHVAVTWDALDGIAGLYLDGALASTLSGVAQGATIQSGGTLVLGQDQDSMGGGFQESQSFEGQVDDIRIWEAVRSVEQIRSTYRQQLTGTEPDLLEYWPVEIGNGDAVANVTDSEGLRYLTLNGGVHRSEINAPIQLCAQSDTEGNYDLSGIRYGDETTFRITPEREGRSFDPAYKSITLSTGNPVQNEVGFNDISSYGISGSVQYAGTQCFVQDLPIGLDGNPTGKTDDDGQYRISAQYGERVVAPQIDGRTFSPASETLFLEEDVFGVNFTETTTRTLSGQVSGGCGISIGTVTLAVESENQCLQRDVVVSSGSYDLDLPPQAYTVRVTDVTDVPAGLSKTEILKYFEGLGSKRVDLTDSTQVADFIYRAPLRVTVSGAPEPAGQCASGLQAAENTLPNVTILDQAPAEGIPLTIEVAEDYGSELCPVDTGTVEVFDEWSDTESEPRERIIADGIARDTTYAVTPTFTSRVVDGVDRTYQKAYTAAATVEGRTAQRTTWALITGRRLREGSDFVTGNTGELPILILRDPPGDASQTTIADSETFCRSVSTSSTIRTENDLSFVANVGFEFRAGFPGFTQKTKLQASSGRSLSIDFSQTNSSTSELCVQTDREYSTSDSPLFVGDQGDVFIGTGLNLVFAETDVLEGDPADACSFDRSTAIAFEPDGFETTYAFTRYHIEEALLPRLADFIDRYEEEYQQTGSDAAFDSLRQFRADYANWKQHLVYNDSLKGASPVAENRSFSAGADYSFSQTTTESDTWEWSTSLDISAGLSVGFSLEAAGNGFSMDFSSTQGGTDGDSRTEDQITERTVNYTLADDDLGDYFTVDIKEDSVYATPVFDLRAGRSSCPWEGPITRLDGSEINGTQPRDGTILQVNGSPLVEGVAPDGEAVFEISLTNDSATDEQREYGVRVIQTSNPDGAQFNLNGNNLKGPANFFLDPGENGTQRATLSVKRGPQRYRYDDLEIMMYPPCEYALWQDNANLQRQDTLRVSARFAAPCSDIELFQPRENWSLNAASAQNPLQVIFSDVSTTEPRELENIGLEYRAAGSDVWKNAFTIARDTLAANGSLTDPDINLYNLAEDWAVPLPDGGYELRAFSKCVNSTERVFSAVTPGVIDTKAPETAQVAPSDGALAFGDAITIDFSEPMDCASVITGGTDPTVTLRTEGGTSIPVDAICSDNQTRVRLQPQIDLGTYEDSTLVAEVRGQITQGTAVKDGVTDAVGNPLETASAISSTETWSFTVKREGFAWQQANVAAASIFGEGILFEEALVNGSPQPVVYSIESRTYGADWSTHPWLVVDSTSISGTVNAGSSLPIAFALSDTLSKGVYRDTVDATTALGPESLNLEATVSCPAPFGTPPQGLAFNMNLSAFLDIPAALGGNGVSTDTSDVVAAYVGNQLRGVASVDQVSLGDGTPAFVAFLSIASDRQIGETVTFRLWDASQCRLYQAQETYPFQSNDVIGSPQAPVPITASDVETQSVDLPSGWTWVSTNKVPASGSSVSNVLSTLVPSEGDIVKSQTDGFAQYSRSTGWVGTLSEIVPGEAYLVNVETPSSLVLLGDPAPLTTDLSLQAGWNWVGYLPEQPLLLNDALANLTPAPQAGDIIKSQFGFAQYVGPSIGWIGSLETLDPGRGYFLNLTTAATLTYPDPSTVTTQTSALIAKASPTSASEGATTAQADFGPRPVRSSDPDAWRTYVRNVTGHRYAEIQASIERQQAKTSPRRSGPSTSPAAPESDAPEWRIDPAAYASATPVVASLSIDGDVLDDPQTRVGAFVDDELRGVARPRYVEALGETRVFLMLYGEFDQPTPVRFRIYDAGTGLVHDDILVVSGTTDAAVSQEARFPNHMDVRADATYGTVQDPVRLNQGALPEDVLPGQFQFESHYPNPVTRSATIRYALPDQGDVEFEVYDVMGRRVAHIPATPKDAGWHDMQIDASDLASGVYFYRLTAGEKQVTKKLVVVK